MDKEEKNIQINQWIERMLSNSERQQTLLKELKEAVESSSCKYRLCVTNVSPKRFTLIDRETGLDAAPYATTPKRIKSFMKIRNIKPEDIYNFKLIHEKR